MPRYWDEQGNELTVADLIRDERAPPVRAWDADGNPIQTPARGTPRSPGWEAAQTLASVNRGIPGAQHLQGALRGAGSMLEGGTFGEGYTAQMNENRALTEDMRARRPNAAAFAEGVGNAVPMVATMGQSSAPQVAGRGLGLWANQTARAGVTGATAGAVYGGTTGDAPGAPIAEQLDYAQQGAAFGGLLGAATPTAVNAVRGTYNALRPAWSALESRLPRIAPQARSGAGAFGGQMFGGGGRPPLRAVPPPPQGPQIPSAAMGTIDRLANRSRMSADQVEQAFAGARANPQGQVVADLFGDPGVRTMRGIAQSPGQSGQRAADVARERFQAAPDRILGELNRRMGVAETPQQALASLGDDYARASAEMYEPLFAQPMRPAARAAADQQLARYADDPVFRDAVVRAQNMFTRDQANGSVQGAITDNYARYLHYIKMGLDDASRFAGTPQSGIQGTELRGIREMRARVMRVIDETVPGYAEARSRWSTISSAEDALDEGRTLINQNSRSVAARVEAMTPFERYHARIGFVNEIYNRVGLRGSVVGNRNVAEALGSPEMQRRISVMFESPEQAAAFLDTLNQQNMLMRNAGQWGAGSQTYSNAVHGADEALNTGADMGVNIMLGNTAGAARRGVQGAANAITGGMIERANNARGEALLRRIDSDEAAAFSRAVVEELRRREAARAAGTAASQAGATAAGSQQGRRRN